MTNNNNNNVVIATPSRVFKNKRQIRIGENLNQNYFSFKSPDKIMNNSVFSSTNYQYSTKTNDQLNPGVNYLNEFIPKKSFN